MPSASVTTKFPCFALSAQRDGAAPAERIPAGRCAATGGVLEGYRTSGGGVEFRYVVAATAVRVVCGGVGGVCSKSPASFCLARARSPAVTPRAHPSPSYEKVSAETPPSHSRTFIRIVLSACDIGSYGDPPHVLNPSNTPPQLVANPSTHRRYDSAGRLRDRVAPPSDPSRVSPSIA